MDDDEMAESVEVLQAAEGTPPARYVDTNAMIVWLYDQLEAAKARPAAIEGGR